ncbi:hypothetical protein [Arcticibacter sp. MXS-1]|uniref:hypothetical protein n=1 Tax=Arcticibacter sp. MXS-1 TaxID=3341726 RepID=UPI0035A950CA
MKRAILLLIPVFLAISCKQNKLDNAQALQLLRESKRYPQTLTADINPADPNLVSSLTNTRLEKAGLIEIHEAMSLGEMGQAQIIFTKKAAPYLIPPSDQDQQAGIQRVKIADEVLLSVTSVTTTDDNRKAIANYVTTYRNITPFSVLSPIKVNTQEHKKEAHFSFVGEKWQLDK